MRSPMFGSHISYNAFLSFLNRRSASIAMGKHTKNMYAMTVPAMTPDTPHDLISTIDETRPTAAATAPYTSCAFMWSAAARRQAIGLQRALIILQAAIQETRSTGGTTAPRVHNRMNGWVMKISGMTAARANPSENDKFRFNVRATHPMSRRAIASAYATHT